MAYTKIPFMRKPPRYFASPTLMGVRGFGDSMTFESDGMQFAVDEYGNVSHYANGAWVGDFVTSPAVQAVAQVDPGLLQTAAGQSNGTYSSFLDRLIQLVPTVIQGKAQYDLMQINLQRAKEGKPPIDASQYTPGVQVGITNDTQRTVLMVAGIGAAALVLSSLARRR